MPLQIFFDNLGAGPLDLVPYFLLRPVDVVVVVAHVEAAVEEVVVTVVVVVVNEEVDTTIS